jgi:DNA repair exonuclease SbcCD nuclease subunit
MKFLHISDTHLGYSAYRKTTDEGINQRELDIYNAFKEFVDYAIKSKPDFIIHAGDLFDSVRPNNRAITFSIKELNRISKENIPFIVIAGNHEHPKLKETGHIFSIFDHMNYIYPLYNAEYETLSFDIKDEKIMIHAVPQCELKTQFDKELKKIKPDSKMDYNIFVSHGAVKGIQVFSMNEFNELMIPAKILSDKFDYIALGHYHKYTKVANNAFYSGSIERYTFTDAPDKKGFLEIDLINKELKHKFIELKNRPMIDPKPIKCSNLKLDQVMKKIKETIKVLEPSEKTFRITLDEIPAHIFRGLDFNEIRKISGKATHYEIKTNLIKEDKSPTSSSPKINALSNEFKQFLEGLDIEEKETILDLGIGYIEKVEAREEGK